MADIDSNSSDGSSLLGDAGKALKGVGEDVTKLAGSAVKNFFGGLTGSAKGGSTDPALSNPNYTVIITQEGKNPITVVGSAPKNFNIQQQATFSAPFAAGLSGILGSTGSDVLAATNGTRLIGHSMTMQMWQGKGSDTDFQITFDLRTWSDPYLDVIAPLQKLLSLTMPGLTDQGFLTSPGPLLDPQKAGKLFAAPIVNTFGKIGSNISSALKGDGTLADKFGAAITGAATIPKFIIPSVTTDKN